MPKIKSATRLALSVGIGCATLVCLAIGLGLVPDANQIRIENRGQLTNSIAVTVASFAESKRNSELALILNRFVQVDHEILSIGIKRDKNRRYLITAGPHVETWQPEIAQDPNRQISTQIWANGLNWGKMEVAFARVGTPGLAGMIGFHFGLVAFIASAMVLLTWLVVGKAFKYLAPSTVVPERVRSALDTLSDGLVLTDTSGKIVHANVAFLSIMQLREDEVLGMQLDDFGWGASEGSVSETFPWVQCLEEKSPVCSEIFQLMLADQAPRQFVINATPIQGANDEPRGALVSFDDVTLMETKNLELAKMIQTLRSSRDEVARQNEQLNFLASFDPLTKCMNRRAFFGLFEKHWADAAEGELAIMMLDVDHFKSVNDNHGHSVGDEVLKQMGQLLRDIVAQQGLVCRYGGEEFVILVPDIGFDDSMVLAESIRQRIETNEAAGIRFTASIGISSRHFGSMDAQHMLDQADESLYIAKRQGRNKVVRFDEREKFSERTNSQDDQELVDEIPYSSVNGLLAALSFRCKSTAEHSIRVADLCVAIGQEMMSQRDLDRLEVAALLHDIGKIGAPESILQKSGPLSEVDMKTMRKHASIGADIVRDGLQLVVVAEAIESHHECYSSPNAVEQKASPENPASLISKVITVCDAFDRMVNDQVNAEPMSISDAIQELKSKCSSQVDADVVECLLQKIASGPLKRTSILNLVRTHRTTVAIDQYVQELCNAVEDEDVDRLSRIVNHLNKDAEQTLAVSDAILSCRTS